MKVLMLIQKAFLATEPSPHLRFKWLNIFWRASRLTGFLPSPLCCEHLFGFLVESVG